MILLARNVYQLYAARIGIGIKYMLTWNLRLLSFLINVCILQGLQVAAHFLLYQFLYQKFLPISKQNRLV